MPTTIQHIEKPKIYYKNKNIAILAFTGALGGLSVGYNCGIVAGANLYLDEILKGEITLSDKSVSTFSLI